MRKKINSRHIPVEVLDTKTGISSQYVSIAEAARYFNIYPKAIWRKVQSGELYKGRYIIKAKHFPKVPRTKRYFIYKKINKIPSLVYSYKSNKNILIIFYLFLLLFILSFVVNRYFYYYVLLFTDIYHSYFPAFIEMDLDTFNSMLKDEFRLNNTKKEILSDNINYLVDINRKLRYEYIFTNNIINSIDLINAKIANYQYWVNKIHSFWIHEDTIVSNTINIIPASSPSASPSSIYSADQSPSSSSYFIKKNVFLGEHIDKSSIKRSIKESVDNTTIFSNAITSNVPTINILNDYTSDKSPIVETQNLYNNHRHYNIIDKSLYGPKSPGRRLLNYESNILFCLINGLSSPNLPRA